VEAAHGNRGWITGRRRRTQLVSSPDPAQEYLLQSWMSIENIAAAQRTQPLHSTSINRVLDTDCHQRVAETLGGLAGHSSFLGDCTSIDCHKAFKRLLTKRAKRPRIGSCNSGYRADAVVRIGQGLRDRWIERFDRQCGMRMPDMPTRRRRTTFAPALVIVIFTGIASRRRTAIYFGSSRRHRTQSERP
jgi:hypothetical protein